MSFWELFALALGLSLDAFAAAVCKGLALGRPGFKDACAVGLWFGGFQAAMPLIGYFFCSLSGCVPGPAGRWAAFALLGAAGFNMIRESRRRGAPDPSLKFASMLALAVATSIDALAAGVTFALLSVDVFPAAALIGAATCVLSALGVGAGGFFGAGHRAGTELAGGVILIFLGVKILLESRGAG